MVTCISLFPKAGTDSTRYNKTVITSVNKTTPGPKIPTPKRVRRMGGFWGAFWGTRALEIVKRNNSPGLLWKRIKLTTTRKANAKKRLHRVWQVFFFFFLYLFFFFPIDRFPFIEGLSFFCFYF